jgi:hypothetical protein
MIPEEFPDLTGDTHESGVNPLIASTGWREELIQKKKTPASGGSFTFLIRARSTSVTVVEIPTPASP